MPELLHNALLRGWLGDAVKKALGAHAKGEGGVERFSETLDLVMNPWGMPEWALLRGERLGAVKGFTAATAAEFAINGLGNPIDSGNVVVVEACAIASSPAASCWLEVCAHTAIVGTVVTTPAMQTARDRRFSQLAGRTVLVAGTDLGNTFGITLEQQVGLVTPAGIMTPFTCCLPVVLKPGDDLVVISQTVNTAIVVNWAWRERKAFPGELA